ncbi:hypothetical protein Halru_0106 [Halovivax ruber XH-70]|uniref:Uncharacterized protein n=1 Tax=Halovivax ruber (strain DSM 18193 / JCM 13892 / XH-70) TaxID=797302 RepID=L0I7J8_HALRX|nr:hypothetical protein [Halovivax ruber]AGB14758.1 hypothetical protein Halru_0106 [Halovivax ruber XH-70]
MTTAYCAVCDWSRETGSETTRSDLNRAMIDHHVETGHTPIETDEVILDENQIGDGGIDVAGQ